MNDDKEYQYKYCGCTRHETRHDVRSESWTNVITGRKFVDNWLVCTECGEEAEA